MVAYKLKVALGWNFFGIGIFYFGLDQKIPKSRGSGSGFEKFEKNPEKISSAKSRKTRNPGDRDWDLKIPEKSQEIPKNPE